MKMICTVKNVVQDRNQSNLTSGHREGKNLYTIAVLVMIMPNRIVGIQNLM